MVGWLSFIFMAKKSKYLEVGEILVSPEIITEYFACDLEVCRGACCVEGVEGAPVAEEEKAPLLEALPQVIDTIPPANVDYMTAHGVLYSPAPGAWATMIVDGGRCVFTCNEEGECCRCAFEKCFTEGRQSLFYKPISCHLYPVRTRRTDAGRTILYYDIWSPLCDAAVARGRREGVRIYRFVRSALERAYGAEWYRQLEEVADHYLSSHE